MYGHTGLFAPYPLAILTGGFTVNAASYRSYGQRLASWGYTVVVYDKGAAWPSSSKQQPVAGGMASAEANADLIDL